MIRSTYCFNLPCVQSDTGSQTFTQMLDDEVENSINPHDFTELYAFIDTHIIFVCEKGVLQQKCYVDL